MNYTIQRCVALTCRRNVNVDVSRKFSTNFVLFEHVLTKRILVTKSRVNCNNLLYCTNVQFNESKPDTNSLLQKIENNYSVGQLKKRPKKRKSLSTDKAILNAWYVKALSTSEEYNLESLVQGLNQQKLYSPNVISTSTSCKYIKIILSI
ncbi:hypothetical protein ANTPLA_LOCUS855 [Anthophora plagiata]